MNTIKDFFSSFIYDSIVIYTYNRGDQFMEYKDKIQQRKTALKEIISTTKNFLNKKQAKEELKKLRSSILLTELILNEDLDIHPTASKVVELNKSNKDLDELLSNWIKESWY